ncbi:hypothetical protein AE74_01941, partial [Klebsiella pneumoniae CHS 18]
FACGIGSARQTRLVLRRTMSGGKEGNDSNLLIVFYVQIMPDDFVMQLHRF